MVEEAYLLAEADLPKDQCLSTSPSSGNTLLPLPSTCIIDQEEKHYSCRASFKWLQDHQFWHRG